MEWIFYVPVGEKWAPICPQFFNQYGCERKRIGFMLAPSARRDIWHVKKYVTPFILKRKYLFVGYQNNEVTLVPQRLAN